MSDQAAERADVLEQDGRASQPAAGRVAALPAVAPLVRTVCVVVGVVALLYVAASAHGAIRSTPPGATLTQGTMRGHPIRIERFARHKLSAKERRYFNRIFVRNIHIGSPAGNSIVLLGVVHKIVWYGRKFNACYYYDGGYVLCAWGKRVVAKGHES